MGASPARKTSRGPHLRVIPGGVGAAKSGAKAMQRQASKHVGPARRPTMPFVVMTALAVAVCVFGLVLLNVMVAQTSLELERLRAQVDEQEALHRKLRFEVATGESPARIAEAAQSLGLVVPSDQRYIIGPSESVRVASDDRSVQPGEIKAMLGGR